MGGLRFAALGTIFSLLLHAGCGGERRDGPPPPPPPASAALGGTTVARVGEHVIDTTMVEKVAKARHLTARQALDLLIEEALLAEAAVDAQNDKGVRLHVAAAQSRILFARILDEARKEGPYTEAEMAALGTEDWIEIDRPETRIVVHALVLKEVKDGAAIAKRLRDELRTVGGTTKQEQESLFTAKAKAFALPPGNKALVVETLDQPFTADGRIAQKGAQSGLDAGFSKAAFAIPQVGDVSDIVETPFGWHVVRLLEVRPGFRAPFEERVRRLEAAILRQRAAPKLDALIQRLQAAAPPVMTATDYDLSLPRFHESAPR